MVAPRCLTFLSEKNPCKSQDYVNQGSESAIANDQKKNAFGSKSGSGSLSSVQPLGGQNALTLNPKFVYFGVFCGKAFLVPPRPE